MFVNDIFFSIQGESTFAGLPCIFIRLAGCNLNCLYCDTPESREDGTDYTLEQILSTIRNYNCSLVEITGGEPLLQSETIVLMEKLHAENYTVLLETNGSISLREVPNHVHAIVDVKLPGSGREDTFLPENIFLLKTGRDELKFVILDRADFDHAVKFISENKLFNYILLFSPVSDKLNPAVLADWIMKSGLPLRLNLQLHKLLNLK